MSPSATTARHLVTGGTVAVVLALALGCGGSAERRPAKRGDTTSQGAILRALNNTGYQFTYREVPRVDGYAMIAGRARNPQSGGVVDFAVTMKRDGPFESAADGERLMTVVRYADSASTTIGNIQYQVQPQSPYKIGHLRNLGRAWLPTKDERAMAVRVAASLARLFTLRYRGAG